MANRFENPIASEFINTYVPIPFDAMMKAGQMKQDRYDRGAAAQDAAIQRAEQIQAIAGSADDDYRRQAIQKMYDIRDKYVGKDLSDSFVLRQMNNEINNGIDKEWIQKMQESKASWDEAQKAKRTLAMNNKWNPILDEDPSQGWNSKEMGQYNYQPRAFTDKTELFNPYYKDLKSESMGIIDSQGYKVQREGISKKKVEDVTNRGAQELLATQQGRDLVKIYRAQHEGATPDKISDVEILRQQMYDYGKQWISSNDTVLGASLQDGAGSGSNKDNQYQLLMQNILAGEDTVAGASAEGKIKTINKEYDAAKAQLASITDPQTGQVMNADSPEVAKLIGFVSKIDDSRRIGEERAKAEIEPQIAKIKQLALSKMKAIPEFSQIPDEVINEVIDQQFAPGFSGSAARLGNTLHQTGDKVIGGAPKHVVQFIANVVQQSARATGNNLLNGMPFNPEQAEQTMNAIAKEEGIGEDYSLGDMFNLALKTSTKIIKDNNITGLTKSIRSSRDKDERNIMRDVVKGVNSLEKQIKTTTDEYVLGKMQHIVSKKQEYPITTTNSGNGEVIVTPTGDKIVSSTAKFLKNLPLTNPSFEIRELSKKGKYEVLDKKSAQSAKIITSTWDKVDNPMIESEVDDEGRLTLHVGYTSPKGSGETSMKEYEIKIAAISPEASKIASDFEALGTPEAIKTAIKLRNYKLKTDIASYIDVPNGHEYPIYSAGSSTPSKVHVQRVDDGYKITVNKGTDDEQSAIKNNKEEVTDALYSLQAAEFFRK